MGAQRVPLSSEKLHWWSVQVQRFVKFVWMRRDASGAEPMEVLVEHFLSDLDVQTPPEGAWQWDQIRQALSVFVLGIRSWLWSWMRSGRYDGVQADDDGPRGRQGCGHARACAWGVWGAGHGGR